MNKHVYVEKPKRKLASWTIHRIRKSPAELVGYVEAQDAESAVTQYIADHNVADWERRRLFARRNS